MTNEEIQRYLEEHREELSRDFRTAPPDVINYIVNEWVASHQDRLHESIDRAINDMKAKGHHWTGIACVILQCVDKDNHVFVNELSDIPEAGAKAAEAYREALGGGPDLGGYL